MSTVADFVSPPPGPVQLRMNVLALVSGPVDSLPELAFAPLQAPDAVQPVASVEDQVRVDDCPETTLVGLAPRDRVGAGGVTVTVTVRLMLPPAPLQLRVKLLLAESGPLDSFPEVAFAPLQAPDAVQLVASVEDQVRVDDCPETTLVGLALKDKVGAGGVTVTVTDCVIVPPAPLQPRVKLLVLASAPVDWLPEVALAPLQAPDAVQPVALLEDQVKVAD